MALVGSGIAGALSSATILQRTLSYWTLLTTPNAMPAIPRWWPEDLPTYSLIALVLGAVLFMVWLYLEPSKHRARKGKRRKLPV